MYLSLGTPFWSTVKAFSSTCTSFAFGGGPYGMALLAAYRVEHADGETLASYLQSRVFAGAASTTLNPDADVYKRQTLYRKRQLSASNSALPASRQC